MSDRLEPLTPERLRWRCDAGHFEFADTTDVRPAEGIVGQDAAVEALRFGLQFHAPGQNIFVRGLESTGRARLVHRLVKQVQPTCPLAQDYAYVCNFDRPDRPVLLELPRGTGHDFRRHVDRLITFIASELVEGLESDVVKAQAAAVDQGFSARVSALTDPFEAELKEAGFAMGSVQAGPVTRQIIVPVLEGRPLTPDVLQALVAEGKVTPEQQAGWDKKIKTFSERAQSIGEQIQDLQGERIEARNAFYQTESRSLLQQAARGLRSAFEGAAVRQFIDAIIEDVVMKRLGEIQEKTEFVERYRVNVVLAHADDPGCPTLVETMPNLQTLIGTIDVVPPDEDEMYVPHMTVRGGSLLQAAGGYIVIDSKDLLPEPGAWRALVRTLRTGDLEIQPTPGPMPVRAAFVKPDPIPIDVKVILLGGARTYYILDGMDPDFRDLFKVLADFDTVIERDKAGLGYYAAAVARIAEEGRLLPFSADGVAALCEHGARIAAQENKLTARFGRLGDLAREAAFLASRAGEDTVGGARVMEAVRRTKQRANLPSRRFQEMIARGVIGVRCRGSAVGQVNGLAVIQAGQLTYGFPNRITATIAPGKDGTINIEDEAALSGSIHTKGFLLLGGLLRTLLAPEHPLAFSASIAFEQSYGGVDGDSASGVEFCCLLSALTGLPARQDLAMTGAIDQVGNVMAIGGVNEKIEGFFDACAHEGLTGSQGVLIPASNAGDLMLRQDVVDACRAGKFGVYAVARIHEAISLLLGQDAGVRDTSGRYPPESVLGLAVARAEAFWHQAHPGRIEA